MSSGYKLLKMVVKAGAQTIKDAERDRIKSAREEQRRLATLYRERVREMNNEEKYRVAQSKLHIKEEKERIAKELEKEIKIFDARVEDRKKLRLMYLNKKN
jgi:D-hexose-6-phosphate mutarotase